MDTGANITAFSTQFYNRYQSILGPMEELPSHTRYRVKAVNDSSLSPIGRIKFRLQLNNRKYNFWAYIIKDLKFDLVVGTDLMYHVRGCVDIYNRQFFFGAPRQSIDIDIGLDDNIISAIYNKPLIQLITTEPKVIPPNSVVHVRVRPSTTPERSTPYSIGRR